MSPTLEKLEVPADCNLSLEERAFLYSQNMVQTTSKIKSVIDIDHMSNETRARFLMELKAYKKTKERNQLLIIIWWMFTIIAGLVATCLYDLIKEGMYLIWGVLFLMNIQMLIVYRIFDKRRFKRLVESFGTPKDEIALVIENETVTEKKKGY